MKVNSIGIFLISLILSNPSFGSPFDIEGIEDIENSDEKDIVEGNANPDNNKDHEKLLNQEIQEEKENKPIKSFDEFFNMNLKIVDIKTGTKSEVKLKAGELENFKGIGLKFQKCFRSIDGKNLSFGYISVSGKDFKTKNTIVSSDVGLSKIIASQYIVKADCF